MKKSDAFHRHPLLIFTKWRLLWTGALFLLLLTGCQAQPNRTLPLNSIWGRGMLVGEGHMREPVAMAVAPDGSRMHLVWPREEDRGTDLYYAQVDGVQGVVAEGQLHSGLFLPRELHLFLLPDGDLWLLTRAKANKKAFSGVYWLQLSATGALQAPPQLLTPEDQEVASFDAAFRAPDVIELVWERSGDEGGGIYQQRLTVRAGEGEMSKPTLLVEEGEGPSLAMEPAGSLHLLWRQDRTEEGDRLIYYAPIDVDATGPVTGTLLLRHGRNVGVRSSSPKLAYDDGHFYVFWDQEFFSGLAAGTASTMVVSFPKGQPEQILKYEIAIPETISEGENWTEGQYLPVTSDDNAAFRSAYVIFPSAMTTSGQRDRLILLMSAKLTYRFKSEMQPVMAVLQDGVQVGYMPIARSNYFSLYPVGAEDDEGRYYAAWNDYRGPGKYLIFFSSTSKAWQTGVLALKREDVTQDIVSEFGFGLLAAGGLIPMLLFVLVLPLVLLGTMALIGQDRSLDTRTGRIQLIVAMVIYYVIKVVAFAPVLTSATFVRFLTPFWSMLMLVLVPVLIFLIALAAMMLYIKRADPPGMITSFFIFAVIDLILTAIIYAPAFY